MDGLLGTLIACEMRISKGKSTSMKVASKIERKNKDDQQCLSSRSYEEEAKFVTILKKKLVNIKVIFPSNALIMGE